MAKTFKTAAAFRTSLEQRLKQLAAARGVALNGLRLKVVIERLLARLFAEPEQRWLLKGGFAMELRYRPNARTTKDIDLGVATPPSAESVKVRLTAIRDEFQALAETDMGDFLVFRIGEPQSELQGAPLGGGRFPVEVLLAGKTYVRFHMDVGFGDPLIGSPEQLTGDTVLDFVGISPVTVSAIPRAQQFAEKLHAYTLPWTDRTNTRTKDLVDLVLLIERDPPSPDSIRHAIHTVFAARKSHPVPATLPAPPRDWDAAYAVMADEAQISVRALDAGFDRLAKFWSDNSLGT